jgi:F0F1-type ATP synthase alpha subunit
MEEQVAVIYAGVNGYLDPLPVNRVKAFEDGLLALLRSSTATFSRRSARRAISPTTSPAS